MAKYDIYYQGAHIKTFEADTMNADSDGQAYFTKDCSIIGVVPADYMVLEKQNEPKTGVREMPNIETSKDVFSQ
jgi:hypothetical protein